MVHEITLEKFIALGGNIDKINNCDLKLAFGNKFDEYAIEGIKLSDRKNLHNEDLYLVYFKNYNILPQSFHPIKINITVKFVLDESYF